TRRHADLAERKKIWAENLAKKEALCVKAEALSQSADWEPAAAEIKKLQNEWKAIGPVKKSRSEAIWQRFRTACDAFFTRYAQRHDIARQPDAFSGTDLDPDANRKRMESLVKRMEDLAKSVAGPASDAAEASLSPTTRLAAMLKEALAANTIGGKVDDDHRLRAAADEVR